MPRLALFFEGLHSNHGYPPHSVGQLPRAEYEIGTNRPGASARHGDGKQDFAGKRRYRSSREWPYWFDVDVFEAGMREAHSLLQAGTQDERAASLLEEDVNLYQHDFAQDVLAGECRVPRREALRYAYREALLPLGRLHGKVWCMERLRRRDPL